MAGYLFVYVQGAVPQAVGIHRDKQARHEAAFAADPGQAEPALVIGKVPGWWVSTNQNPAIEKPMMMMYSIAAIPIWVRA